MSIIIGADIVPVDSNRNLFENALVDQLVGEELLEIISRADFRIFNLEVPLTDTATPIEKHGRNLIASTKSVNGIKKLGVDLVTMANNHIMDQGIQGLQSTIQALNNAEIRFVGVGSNLKEAQQPYYFISKGIKYGVYACAEHEFSIAQDDYPGANPFDPFESLDHVASMKASCDYVIVLYHGGKEQYRYPSPSLQKTCRKFIDKGADFVICQHSHCIGCKEEYKNGTVVYGQGNFLFSQWDNEYWNSGLLIRINNNKSVDYLPIVKAKRGVRLAKNDEKDKILAEFEVRSEQIKQSGFINENYEKLANTLIDDYLLNISGRHNYLFRLLNKVSGNRLKRIYSSRYKKRIGLYLRNTIECEAHRELIIKGLM